MMTKDKGDEEETPSHYILHVNVYLFSTWRNFEEVDDDLFSFKTGLTALALSAGTLEINPSATKSWFKMEPPAYNDRFQKSTLTQEDFLT